MKHIFSLSLIAGLLLTGAAFAAGTAPDAPKSGSVIDNPLIKNAPLPNDYVMGKKEAPVVLIEYGSLSCSHCAHFSTSVLPELEKKYIETGKVRYVLRSFIRNEPDLKGSMLLDCVGKDSTERYFTFAKVLLDAQSKWAFDGNWQSGLETIASVGGVSKEQFKSCLASTDRETRLLKAFKQAADELKIEGTPYFTINGKLYDGPRDVESMSAFIEAELAAKK